jgi:D-alanyl-D-alanine carboxypeptidase/D-alanyl-D-alanine-endopeptidase (penicillin-binding protein 4)
VSTLAPVQGPSDSRIALSSALAGALAVVLTLLIGAAPASATRSALPGPDLPFRSAPGLDRRSGSSAIGLGKLQRKLKGLAREAPGASGYYVADLEAKDHRVLFDRKEGERRRLASNEKLFTTTTALHILGPDSTLVTKVKAGGKVTPTGRLQGSLYLIGDGDPSFGTSGVDDLASDVRRAGIKRVTGTVVADDSIFDRLRGVPDSNYGPSPYVAPLGGLVFGGSTYDGDPAKEAGKEFRGALRHAGVRIGGKVKLGEVPRKLRGTDEVGKHKSDTIAQLVAATNKPSDNFYAEMLLKRLDAASGHTGTTRGGVAAVERYARSLGSKVSARDGSGLTANNRSSPRDIVKLLDAIRRDDDVGVPLFDSLSIAGQDGTLSDRMGGTVAAGRCRGKTGTIEGVSNLSGYCRSGSGLVAFSLLMNGVTDLDGAHSVQDRMVVQIARYRP